MNCNTFSALADFRQNIYADFRNGRDALFDARDALRVETQARSFDAFSLSPLFVRQATSLADSLKTILSFALTSGQMPATMTGTKLHSRSRIARNTDRTTAS